MVDDKYIGLALAICSSFAIGTSFIITKKGLNSAGKNAEYASASAYMKSPLWWAGMVTMIIGEVMNFAAYTFAPPILVTPLGALSVLIGAILASFLLGEELGHLGRVGCTLCLLGALIIVLNAPEDKPIETVDEVFRYALQPGFLLYCLTVLVFTLIMIYAVAPRYGRTEPIVYISICSLVGSISIMAVKGFGVAVKLTFAGSNQFIYASTYFFAFSVAGCIMVQMNYFNKALDTFSTNVVNPMYFVGFSTATILASLILFQGFNTTGGASTMTLVAGFVVTFLGVHLLNISRQEDPKDAALNSHSTLETGLMNPRLSLTGRMSLDGWNTSTARPDGAPQSSGHGRRSSLYRSQTQTLFNTFEEEEEAANSLPLERLREEEEYSDNPDADERTRLRDGVRPGSNDTRSPQQVASPSPRR